MQVTIKLNARTQAALISAALIVLSLLLASHGGVDPNTVTLWNGMVIVLATFSLIGGIVCALVAIVSHLAVSYDKDEKQENK